MAGRRQGRPARSDLGDSWADVSSEDDVSDGGESLEIHESEDDAHLPTASIEANTQLGASSPRRSMRASQRSLNPDPTESIRTPMSASQRRSARLESRNNSVEPEFIMPSMMASGSLKGSPAKPSPLSNSVRARKARLSASRVTPSRVVQSSSKTSSPKTHKSSKKAHARQNSPLASIWCHAIQPVLAYILGVIGYAMLHLKPLFGALLAVLAIFYGFKLAFHSTFGALSILPDMTGMIPSPCSVPLINMLPMCKHTFPPGATPEFEDLMKVQSSFEDIIQSTAKGMFLPTEMKRSEASIRDLKYVVMYSNLPSKGELVYEFQGFIDIARQASGDLTKFNSRVGRAVDHIISTNKHTLQVIDGFVETEASRGTLSRWLWYSGGLTQDHLLQQYLSHTSRVEEEIQRLISEAQMLLMILEDLDNRLDVIHGVVTRDGVNVRDSREELFAQMWTKLGGNRNSVHRLDQQLQLLKSVNTYRKAAWKHVAATLLRLQEISAGLEDLRERMGMPENVGIEVIPLQQHIETIQMGVERLEKVREDSRTVERDGQRMVLDEADQRGNRDTMVAGKSTMRIEPL